MSTGLIIVIVVAVLIVLGLLALFAGRGRQRRLDTRARTGGRDQA